MSEKKTRRNITLDSDVDEAITEHPDDFSPFVNRVARKKFVEGRGHVLEDVVTDELESSIKNHIENAEDKLTEIRNQADEMRQKADEMDEAADEIETELNELRGAIDTAIDSAKETVADREEDITATSVADETTWEQAVDSLGDMSYETLAWHREDGGSPPGKKMGHTDTVNEALRQQAEKLGIHHDKLLNKLVEEGHVTREPLFESAKGRES